VIRLVESALGLVTVSGTVVNVMVGFAGGDVQRVHGQVAVAGAETFVS
jgi:hypothetical protein